MLNDDEAILVLVDEAHRSHTNTAHANLMRALPNCAKIGFTGTPIIMRAKKRTHEIFGEFIDRYTIRESEADGATVPILYEGRTTGRRGGGRRATSTSCSRTCSAGARPRSWRRSSRSTPPRATSWRPSALIAAKARDMLRHYVENILPNGFKAQVVAVSRRATIRYYDAFQRGAGRAGRRSWRPCTPTCSTWTTSRSNQLAAEKAFLVRAHRFLPDDPGAGVRPGHLRRAQRHAWTRRVNGRPAPRSTPASPASRSRCSPTAQYPRPDKADPLAFLIVKSMLLTGLRRPGRAGDVPGPATSRRPSCCRPSPA